MQVTVKIKRFDPKKDSAPYFQEYQVAVEPTSRLVDVLNTISRSQDASLAYRASCMHGVCGSDAMIINGKEGLACKVLIKEIATEGQTISLEPLNNLEVERDLIVNQEPFFERYRSVSPYFIPKEAAPEAEYIQSPEDREVFDEATQCISCGACFSACPVLKDNLMPEFIGPMALVHSSRFTDDSRDKGLEERINFLDQPHVIWGCQNKFECTKVCPKGIKITKLINFTKNKVKAYREAQGQKVNDGT